MDLSFFKGKENALDDLTGVYERQVIVSYMQYLISQDQIFTFSILDIDNFKFVNDNYGHLVGDEVLKCVAEDLKRVSKDFGVVGRYGGDEFIFVFPDVQEYDDAWQCGFNILKSTNNLVIPSAKTLNVSYTMGISRYPSDTRDIDELFTLADKALYRGKIKGRNCFIIYLPEKHKNIDLLTKRDKVYTPMHINNKIYEMLTSNDDIEKVLTDALAFVGSYLMLEHICIETVDKELKFDYHHPLAKRTGGYKPYGIETILEKCDSQGLFYDNVTTNKYKENPCELYREFEEQKIYASFLSRIKAFDKLYGFLRVDMVATDTGRIWQQNDLVILVNLANIIGLVLYSKKKKI